MATKVRVKKKTPTKRAVKALPAAQTRKHNGNGSAQGSLTMAERHRLAKCIAPGDNKCPAVNGKDSSFMYQQGCRAEACRIANKAYYQQWRARRAAAATKKRKPVKKTAKKATKKTAKKAVKKKVVAKKK